MPSQSFQMFRKNLSEAEALQNTYEILEEYDGRAGQPGRRSYGHITKSGVLMLCAAWEVYVEDITREIVGLILYNANSLLDMPDQFRILVRQKVIEYFSGKETKPISNPAAVAIFDRDLAHNVNLILEDKLSSFHTPKQENTEDLLVKFCGVSKNNIPWIEANGKAVIDIFVQKRGEIAHNARNAPYPTRDEFARDIETVTRQASMIDNFACEHLKTRYGKFPWKRISLS